MPARCPHGAVKPISPFRRICNPAEVNIRTCSPVKGALQMLIFTWAGLQILPNRRTENGGTGRRGRRYGLSRVEVRGRVKITSLFDKITSLFDKITTLFDKITTLLVKITTLFDSFSSLYPLETTELGSHFCSVRILFVNLQRHVS